MSTRLSATAIEVLTHYRFRSDPSAAELPGDVLAEGNQELLAAGLIELLDGQGDKARYQLTEAGRNWTLREGHSAE